MIIKVRTHYILCLAFLVGLCLSCSTKKNVLPVVYTGPLKEIENIETVYTEDNMIKLKMKAEKVFEFQNGDKEFPEGIHMEFYEQGKMISVLQANKAYYFEKDKKWRGQGEVKVDNMINNQHLRTEELFWRSDKERIFTDKFIHIRLDNELIYGSGLDAAHDLSDYTITNPAGEFTIEN